MIRCSRNLLVRVLIGLMVWMPAQFAMAGMIGTDLAQGVERAAVVSKLEAFGVDPLEAQQRVGAMSDDEVRALAEGVESLPSGKETTAAVAIIALVVFVLWWNLRRR